MSGTFEIVDFQEIPGVPCPCGTARRAFVDRADYPATIHQTIITEQAETHYHKVQTEVYYILECEPDAKMELNGTLFPIRSGQCILIPPETRHRGVGKMTILNIVLPKFDPADEHFD
ncbi:MAG TPA: cupin domain-containing protein [Planctomicrobium sp.]|nr:cupin domain-containing protein [Planctomicrobium sp.]